jgi:hypothetical protein
LETPQPYRELVLALGPTAYWFASDNGPVFPRLPEGAQVFIAQSFLEDSEVSGEPGRVLHHH